MQTSQFQDLFVSRASSLCYYLFDVEENNRGWVGGNAPAYFDDKQSMVNEPDCPYRFYLTAVNPINGKMLTVFIPSFDIYNSHKVYPDCAIKVFEHEVSPESQLRLYELFEDEPQEKKTKYQQDFDYSQPTIRKTYLSETGTGKPFFQLGGYPNLLQDDKYYYSELEKDGYGFFGLADEDGYLNGMIHGNEPFCYGAIYLYAKIENNAARDIIAGFWQNS